MVEQFCWEILFFPVYLVYLLAICFLQLVNGVAIQRHLVQILLDLLVWRRPSNQQMKSRAVTSFKRLDQKLSSPVNQLLLIRNTQSLSLSTVFKDSHDFMSLAAGFNFSLSFNMSAFILQRCRFIQCRLTLGWWSIPSRCCDWFWFGVVSWCCPLGSSFIQSFVLAVSTM